MKDNYKSRIMKNLFNYWFKTNKKSLYDQLGKEFNVSGFRVYKLAHVFITSYYSMFYK